MGLARGLWLEACQEDRFVDSNVSVDGLVGR